MGDPPSPHLRSPPISPQKSNFTMFYYGLAVVGIATVTFALYNIIVVRWCVGFQNRRSRLSMNNNPACTADRGFHNLHATFVTSLMYKKDELGCDSDCPVCLCVFEEGEEIRELPNCKHSFHATCIDLWLYSHMDCPLCRSAVTWLPTSSCPRAAGTSR